MNRNTWGNVMVALFALFVFAVSVQYERFHHGVVAPAITVVSAALLDTLLIVGGTVCAMLVGLHFVRKHSKNKRGD